MRIIVASNSDAISEFLNDAGHEASTVYANKIVLQTAKESNCDVVVYISDIQAVLPHERVVKELFEEGFRLVVAADPGSTLGRYAKALGVKDILALPVVPNEFLLRLDDSVSFPMTESEGINPSEVLIPESKGNNQAKVVRSRSVTPTVLLAIGEPRIEDWIGKNYEGRLTVLGSTVNEEEFKQQVMSLKPDIVILMRQSVLGGIPDAGKLATWSTEHVPAILFIVGELDRVGLDMASAAKEAGVHNIISCEKGGQLAGDDLNYAIVSIIRELDSAGTSQGVNDQGGNTVSSEAKKALNSYLGDSIRAITKTVTSVAERPKEKPNKKVHNPRIKKAEGISLEVEPQSQIYSSQVLKNPTALVPGGVLAVVSPWKPNLAGRISARAVRVFQEVDGGEVVYIGASSESTGAVWLEIPDEELMMSDWRVPGSCCPIKQGNLKLYAVDPSKDLRPNSDNELWSILKEARKTATYTVLDLAGDVALAQKAVHQGWTVVLVIVPGNDPVEQKIATMWLRNLMDGKQNIVTGVDLRGVSAGIPEGLKPKVVVRNNPADALVMALKRNNNDEFNWN